jgi:hypothetical protein
VAIHVASATAIASATGPPVSSMVGASAASTSMVGVLQVFGYRGAPSQSFLSHNGILAIREPFTNFYMMKFRLSWTFHEFFFHTMEFRLSRSLAQTFHSQDGISAIMEP